MGDPAQRRDELAHHGPGDVNPIYAEWRDRLIEALDPRYYGPEWLDNMVAGAARLFIGLRSCAAAELIQFPTGAIDVHVICAAGDPIDARDMIVPQLETWGRMAGALSIIVTSRPAWARILRPSGFEVYKTTVMKEL
jgi:hypothetical protein